MPNNYPPEYPAYEQREYEEAKAESVRNAKIEQHKEEIKDGQHDQALIELFIEDADNSMTKEQIIEALATKLAEDAA